MHCLAPNASHQEAEGPLTDELSQKPALLYFIGISLLCMRHEAIGTALQLPASFPNHPVYKYQLMEDGKSEENNKMLMSFHLLCLPSRRDTLQQSLAAGSRV